METAEPLGLAEGDSVAVNGVCLTATGVDGGGFGADVMEETLRRTALGALARRSRREPGAAAARRRPPRAATSCRATSTASATVESVDRGGLRARGAHSRAAEDLLRYVVEKGSVAVDGVSLTVADVDDAGFASRSSRRPWSAPRWARAEPGRR